MTNINLLPPEIAQKRVTERRRMYMIVAGLLAMGAVLLVWFVIGLQVQTAQRRVEELQKKAEQRIAEKAQLQQFEDRKNELLKKKSIAEEVIANEVEWAKLLNEVSMIIPSDIWLTKFTGDEVEGLTFQGYAFDETPTASETTATAVQGHKPVAKWMVRLSLVKDLINIWLNKSAMGEFEDQRVIQFENTASFGQSHSPPSASAPTAPPAATPQTGQSPGGQQ